MPAQPHPNDLRDLYIKLNPNGWCDEDLEKDSLGFVDPHTSQDFNSFLAGHQAGQEDNERITAERDQLHRLLNERDEEVDRLRAKLEMARRERNNYLGWCRDARGEAIKLRAQLATEKIRADVAVGDANDAERKLAEAQALLRLIAEQPMLNGVHRARIKTLLSASAEPSAPLPPVDGDLLPPINSKVLIHLGREEKWVEHTVVGYYAWGNHGLDQNVHRVFVRVRDAEGYLNARLLSDVRPVDAAPPQL